MAETLIVELDARTASLERALLRVNNRLDNTEDSASQAGSSLKKMSKAGSVAGAALAKTAKAGLALATALTAVVLKSAASQQELALLSRQAKLSTDDFEALAFATKQYGINAEQIADISKDLSDKLGEFSKVGTGAFQDFADIAGLTKDEAKAMAREFENMSSDQVIGEMVRKMEEAGASSNQMTFALESMGNDLSRLIPLFADSSKELDKMTSMYAKATKQMKLSAGEIADLQEAATAFDLMTDSLGQAGELISAQVAPIISDFFNGVIDVVPDATQVVVDFINSFKAAEDIKSIDSINRLIDEQKAKVSELRQEQTKLGKTFATWLDSDKSIATQTDILNNKIDAENKRIKELIEQREALAEQERVADAKRLEKKEIKIREATGTGDEVQAIVDRFKTEEELLAEKYEREKEMLGEALAEKLGLEQEYLNNLAVIRAEHDAIAMEQGEELRGLFEENNKQDAADAKKSNKQKEDSDKQYLNAATTIAGALFEDNKAVKAGLVVVDAAAGISKAFAELPYPAALAASASIAATGVAQLAAIQSASKGGGSVSSGGVVSAPTAEAEPQASVTVSDADVSGESQSKVVVAASADDIAIALNELMNGAKVSGVIS